MDINEMEKQIISTKGFKINAIMQALDMSLQIFKRNYNEISKLIKDFDFPLYNLIFWSEKNKYMRIEFQIELYRTFVNFESASASLIDHSRNFSKKDIKDGIKDKYAEKVKEYFADNGLANFIKDFRNYLLHKEYPNIEISTELSNNKNYIYFNKDELEIWDGWKSKSKIFLKEQDRNLSIEMLVDDYYKLVVEFYEWLFDELRKEYKDEYEEVNTLIKRFNKTFFGTEI